MINEIQAKKFCKEDISKIENYDKAVNDTTQTWHCHHRDEIRILQSGITVIRSRQELIENGRYYKCPANELIFLTKEEHKSLHFSNLSDETIRKRSNSLKGRTQSEETRRKIGKANKCKIDSIFGKAFYEHYGITHIDNKKLYSKEYNFYIYHGHFSWEVM